MPICSLVCLVELHSISDTPGERGEKKTLKLPSCSSVRTPDPVVEAPFMNVALTKRKERSELIFFLFFFFFYL